MHREILIECSPYLAVMAAMLGVLALLVRLSGARFRPAHLRRLHRDEHGGVQSLSFVLTLPVFIMIMMFVVQLSQITIGKIMVEYAAFAAARSGMVWIPARIDDTLEAENQISLPVYVADLPGSDGRIWSVYSISADPTSPKYNKIHFAAAMAVMPVCPSRELKFDRSHPGNAAASALKNAYAAMSPATRGNTRINPRLENKLAYALKHTRVELEIRHKDSEPPLIMHEIGPDIYEFRVNEFGWQDQIYVTVQHDFALLPGPARILGRDPQAPVGTSIEESPATDELGQRIERKTNYYVYPLKAEVRLSNEGQKPVLPYYQPLYGSGGGSSDLGY